MNGFFEGLRGIKFKVAKKSDVKNVVALYLLNVLTDFDKIAHCYIQAVSVFHVVRESQGHIKVIYSSEILRWVSKFMLSFNICETRDNLMSDLMQTVRE